LRFFTLHPITIKIESNPFSLAKVFDNEP